MTPTDGPKRAELTPLTKTVIGREERSEIPFYREYDIHSLLVGLGEISLPSVSLTAALALVRPETFDVARPDCLQPQTGVENVD